MIDYHLVLGFLHLWTPMKPLCNGQIENPAYGKHFIRHDHGKYSIISGMMIFVEMVYFIGYCDCTFFFNRFSPEAQTFVCAIICYPISVPSWNCMFLNCFFRLLRISSSGIAYTVDMTMKPSKIMYFYVILIFWIISYWFQLVAINRTNRNKADIQSFS